MDVDFVISVSLPIKIRLGWYKFITSLMYEKDLKNSKVMLMGFDVVKWFRICEVNSSMKLSRASFLSLPNIDVDKEHDMTMVSPFEAIFSR
jgi:hypothetical protein